MPSWLVETNFQNFNTSNEFLNSSTLNSNEQRLTNSTQQFRPKLGCSQMGCIGKHSKQQD